MKSFLVRTPVKTAILLILTTFVSVSIGMLGSWSKNQECFGLKIFLFVLSVVLYLSFSIFYAVNDSNERRLLSELRTQIKEYEQLLTHILYICKDNSTSINDVIHKANEEKKLDTEIWNFDKASMAVCKCIHNFINTAKNITDFDVAYVRLNEEKDSCVYMNAYANQNNARPTIFNVERYFKNIDEKNIYYDLKLFHKNSADIVVLIGQEVYDKFCHIGIISDIVNKNKQYVAIPVFCKDQKMIGLLEVTCHIENGLGINKSEVVEFSTKYLVPFAHLLLVLHKMEKAIVAGIDKNKIKKDTPSNEDISRIGV